MTAPDEKGESELSAPPDPLRENPPADQFCDLVLNGGIASGVVYPWALVELARSYRFRNLGGNSVGAMAAAVAAAAEYGRCCGVENAFEPLRLLPLRLADVKLGKTKMLRLFQPSPPVRRLFELFLAVIHRINPAEDSVAVKPASPEAASADPVRKGGPPTLSTLGLIFLVLRMYKLDFALALLLLLAGAAAYRAPGWWGLPVAVLGIAGAFAMALVFAAALFYKDLLALARNDYGLCTGQSQEPGEEGLVEWLHRGIQISAGRGEEDPPLTFADLWTTPRFGQAGPAPLPGGLQPDEPGINLQMFASNITQGRPVRLPLNDPNTRLYYHPEEWARYFPASLMDSLKKASRRYMPASPSDPDAVAVGVDDPEAAKLMGELYELPSGGMPIVMAARLSLCFPVLFSCIGVYAVDYEAPLKYRRLRRCLLSDGGLCTNFPVHLFDAAHPRWPTFAFLLDKRLRKYKDDALWRPDKHLAGRADSWLRFVPGAEDADKEGRCLLSKLVGFAGGLIVTTKDWNDRVTGRLPHVRNRIIRLWLQDGEGQLNIDMPPETIVRMAREYGTRAGGKLVKSFAPDGSHAKPAWREHIYVRSIIELRSLRQHLKGYARAAHAGGSTASLREVLDRATERPPLRADHDRPDPNAAPLTALQRMALERAVNAVETLEAELSACGSEFGPYVPVIEPELHLRPPM